MRATRLQFGLRIPPALWAAAMTLTVLVGALVLGSIAASKPLLAAGGAIVGVLGLAVATVPELATVTAIFLMFANIPVVLVRFHGVPKVVGQAVALLLVVPVLEYIVFRRERVVIHPVLPLIVMFLGVQTLGALFSPDPATSLAEIPEYALEGLALFFLVTNAVRSLPTLRWATWALLAAGFVMAVVPVFQQLTSSFDSSFGGFGQTTDLGFRTGEVASGTEVTQVRLSGTIGEQNRFAQNMLMLVPLGLCAAAGQRGGRGLLAFGLAGFAGLGCALAFSRGAAVAFVMTIVAMYALRLITRRQLAIVAVGAVLVIAAMPQYWTRLATMRDLPALFGGTATAQQTDGAVRGRATEMIAAAQVFVDHPLIGAGPAMFKHYSRQYGNQLGLRRLDEGRQAHSLFLGIAAENGALGLLAFLGMVGVTMYGLMQVRARCSLEQPELASLASGYLAALVAYLASGIFLHMSYIRFFFLVLGLAAATTYVARTIAPPPRTMLPDAPE